LQSIDARLDTKEALYSFLPARHLASRRSSMPFRFKFQCFVVAGLCAIIPATVFSQNLSSSSVITARREAGGINPGYSLPAASLPELPLAAHAFPSPTPSTPTPSNQASEDDREVSWRKLPMNLLHDQKDMWLFPLKLGKGRYCLPALFITGGTAAFLATDPQVMPHFRKTNTFHDFNRVLGTSATGAAIAVVPAAFYAVSLLRKDSYGQSTALFAGEAVADDIILMVVTKAITRRQRPTERPVDGPYNDTFFHSNGSIFGKGTSFPSGHAMMAFSVATIFARRYHDHRWVPYVAYAVASAIAFSRVTTGAHFPADVFIGASLGYVVARYDVLHGQ
jgi:membrane-associated phospholipid phosphatase